MHQNAGDLLGSGRFNDTANMSFSKLKGNKLECDFGNPLYTTLIKTFSLHTENYRPTTALVTWPVPLFATSPLS